MAAIESHPIPCISRAQIFRDTECRRGMARKASLRKVAHIVPHSNRSLVKLSSLDQNNLFIATRSGHLSIKDNVL